MRLLGVVLLGVGAMCWARPDFRQYISKEGSSEEKGGQDSGTRQTSCPCGWTNKVRIVGGKETLPNEFPLQAALLERSSGKLWCGGSILTEHHVLTASHCTQPKQASDLLVVAGGHDIVNGKQEGNTVIVDVEYTIEHEKYDPRTLEYDIALVVLAKPLKFTQYIGPVCMPTRREDLLNQYVKVLGWGMIKNKKRNGPAVLSDVLLKVNLRVIPMEDCQESYPFQPLDLPDKRQICTFRRSKDSCGGDSGGPLLRLDPDTNRYTQVALVSYGRSCGKQTPAINTDVYYYLQWIQEKLAGTKKGGSMCHKI